MTSLAAWLPSTFDVAYVVLQLLLVAELDWEEVAPLARGLGDEDADVGRLGALVQQHDREGAVRQRADPRLADAPAGHERAQSREPKGTFTEL